MSAPRALRIAAWVFAAGLGVAVAALVWSTHATKRRAAKVLYEVQAFDLNNTTPEGIRSMVDRLGGEVSPSATNCPAEDCLLFIWVANKWMPRLRLAPPMSLTVWIRIQGGKAIYRKVELVNRAYEGHVPSASVTEYACTECEVPNDKPFRIGGLRYEDGTPIYMLVYLNARASPEQRRRAYAFNLECLTKFGGCTNPDEMLPGVRE